MSQARGLAERGNSKGALRVLEDWLQHPPVRTSDADTLALRLEAARQAAATGEPARAASHLATVQRLSNSVSRAPALQVRLLRETARVYAQIGDFRDAVPLLSRAVDALASTEPAAAGEAANALGTAWLELRNPSEAIAAFEWARGLLASAAADKKERVTVSVNLSNAELAADDLPAARAAADRAQQEAEGDASLDDAVNFARAQLLFREVRLTEAEAILQEIAERPTVSDPALRGHALLLLSTSRFDRGVYPEADAAALGKV